MGTFRFKKFSVCDDDASMKVGTDAVLLGAWASVNNAKVVLDIGAGCGIIALMIAQRAVDATIDAIEVSEKDSEQAKKNIDNSPWREKISVITTSVQKFDPPKKYDLIVCNPPFFSNSLLPPLYDRTIVRHDVGLSHDDVVRSACRLLDTHGLFCVILPTSEGDRFIAKARSEHLHLHRITRFFSRNTKPQERSLMQFGFAMVPLSEDKLTLYLRDNHWTEEYRALTGDFYLDR